MARLQARASLTLPSRARPYSRIVLKSLRPTAADAEFAPAEWRPVLWAQVVIGSALLGLLIGFVAVNLLGNLAGGDRRFSLTRWEAENFVGTLFTQLGLGPSPDGRVAEESLLRYFSLTSAIRAELDEPDADLTLLTALYNERSVYENDVEEIVERYIDEAIQAAGLQETMPLFSDIELTWPPVQFELTGPPQLLVRSPRDRIERVSDTLLQNDLTLADIEQIEHDAEDDDTAAIVVSIGGLAAYPAIVRDNRTYGSLLDTASHEWVHHYLAFYPLGRTWGRGGDAHVLNETTANIAGRAFADLVQQRHSIEFPDGEDGRGPPGGAPLIEFEPVMRQLRLDVDGLLAADRVAEAEALMERQRQYLEDNGIYIRKINQAYFAFYGSYGDSPASSDPIGPKIEEIWERTGEVGTFLKIMREVENVDELDEVLERVRASFNPLSGVE
jgi:hypothetical protein